MRMPREGSIARRLDPTGAGDIEGPMAHRAARGFVFTTAQAVGSKALTIVGQIILAWLLLREDFGLIGLAYTIVTVISLIQQAGIREILIQRGRQFRRWANAGFWMSLALGLGGSLIMVALTPAAAWFYEEPRLIGIVAVLALGNLIHTLTIVPQARLQIDLNFPLLAYTGLLAAAVSVGASILFALLGFGAYSFALPVPLSQFVRLVFLWVAARPPIQPNPQFRRWRFMLTDSGLLIAIMAMYAVTAQGDYIILGRMFPPEIVGLYYWAFALSTQSVQMIALNLATVLFPSFSLLKDEPQRLRDGFLRAARVLALVSIPACLLQAAVARPAVHLLFDTRWHDGIVLVQFLSVGWALFSTAYASDSLLKAQGRFLTLFLQWTLLAGLFLACVIIGARTWGVIGAAAGVTVYAWLAGPLGMFIALRPMGGRWSDVARVFLPPILAGGLSIAAGMLVGWVVRAMLPDVGRWPALIEIIVITAVSAVLFIPAIRLLAAEPWRDLLGRLSGMRGSTWAPQAGAGGTL